MLLRALCLLAVASLALGHSLTYSGSPTPPQTGCAPYIVNGGNYYYDVARLNSPTGYQFIEGAGGSSASAPPPPNRAAYTFTMNFCGGVACADNFVARNVTAGVCQAWTETKGGVPKNYAHVCGLANSIQFETSYLGELAGLTVTMDGGDPCVHHGNVNRTTTINVICDDKYETNPQLTYIGETVCSYAFELRAVHGACPISATIPVTSGSSASVPKSPSLTKKMGGGSIFLIIFFVSTFIYVVFGSIFKRVVTGATGFEAIPHIELWRDLPSLFADGIRYSLSCGAARSTATYDAI